MGKCAYCNKTMPFIDSNAPMLCEACVADGVVLQGESQTPKASRSGAAAEGSVDVTPSAGAEGRQSPGPGEPLRLGKIGDTSRALPAGLSLAAHVPAGLAASRDAIARECREEHFQGTADKNMYTWEELPDHHKARWLALADRLLALAAPGAPQTLEHSEDPLGMAKSLHDAGVMERKPAEPLHEEGPAGVDLEVAEMMRAEFIDGDRAIYPVSTEHYLPLARKIISSLHALAHMLGWHGCRLEHAPLGRHLWLWTVCVTCGSRKPLTHSLACGCPGSAPAGGQSPGTGVP